LRRTSDRERSPVHKTLYFVPGRPECSALGRIALEDIFHKLPCRRFHVAQTACFRYRLIQKPAFWRSWRKERPAKRISHLTVRQIFPPITARRCPFLSTGH